MPISFASRNIKSDIECFLMSNWMFLFLKKHSVGILSWCDRMPVSFASRNIQLDMALASRLWFRKTGERVVSCALLLLMLPNSDPELLLWHCDVVKCSCQSSLKQLQEKKQVSGAQNKRWVICQDEQHGADRTLCDVFPHFIQVYNSISALDLDFYVPFDFRSARTYIYLCSVAINDVWLTVLEKK